LVFCLKEVTVLLFGKMLWRIYGPKKGEITEGWRKMHNKELHNLYSVADIIRVIKSRRMR
jgi:hypothetical protein